MQPVEVSVILSPAKLARLDAWRQVQDFPPKGTVVIRKSLDLFLDQCDAPPESNYERRSCLGNTV